MFPAQKIWATPIEQHDARCVVLWQTANLLEVKTFIIKMCSLSIFAFTNADY